MRTAARFGGPFVFVDSGEPARYVLTVSPWECVG
jgi:hypothetical protein